MRQKINYKELLRTTGGDIKDNLLGLTGILISLLEVQSPILKYTLLAISAWLAYDMVSSIRKSWMLIREKHVPIIVDVGDDDSFVDNMRESAIGCMRENKFRFNPRVYDKHFNVDEADTTISFESVLGQNEQDWYRVLRDFEGRLTRLNTRLQGSRTIHMFMKCPTVLALGLGAISGSKNAVVLYHHVDSQYKKVFDMHCDPEMERLGSHVMKNPVKPPYKYIHVNEPGIDSGILYITLDMASHSTFAAVNARAKEYGAVVLEIGNNYDNTLDTNGDWRQPAQECITVIRKWMSKPKFHQIEFFASAPVPLSFAIGMGLGTPSKLIVNHWFREKNTYHPVYELNKI